MQGIEDKVTRNNGGLRKESLGKKPNQAAAEFEHVIVMGNAKSVETRRVVMKHTHEAQDSYSNLSGEQNLFAEHHQDPLPKPGDELMEEATKQFQEGNKEVCYRMVVEADNPDALLHKVNDERVMAAVLENYVNL